MSRLARFNSWLNTLGGPVERSNDTQISFYDWQQMMESFFAYQGVSYTLPGASQEEIGSGLSSTARLAYKSNGVVFAVMLVRQLLFSEARFMFQRLRGGRPGDLWAPPPSQDLFGELALLENPWPGATTGDLLSRMIQFADLAGNAFVARMPDRLMVLRPDWVTIVAGSNADDSSVWDIDSTVVGYVYQEGGPGSGKQPVFFDATSVAHFAPIPDPEARYRGMSWLSPIVREIMADKAATEHKLKFFENGATPNLAVKLDVDSLDMFQSWIKEFRAQHEGVSNAYKTLFLGAGADVTVVGADMRQLDFKITQGAGETRIAAAGGVPPVLVGLSEGLAAATYSNYQQSSRRLADGTLRPLWRNAAASLATIIRVPSDSRLWYDDRDIQFLKEDQKDAASIAQTDASSIQILVNSGFEPDSAVSAIASRDMSLLVHTGMVSVQLQPPGTDPAASAAPELPAPSPPSREMPLELLERLIDMRSLPPAPIEVAAPVVNISPPDVHVDVQPPSVTVQPAEVRVESPVTVEAAQITVEPARVDPGAVQVHVEASSPPEVNVTVERSGKKRVEFADGRGATVREGDVTVVEFDDGREATITEVDE